MSTSSTTTSSWLSKLRAKLAQSQSSFEFQHAFPPTPPPKPITQSTSQQTSTTSQPHIQQPKPQQFHPLAQPKQPQQQHQQQHPKPQAQIQVTQKPPQFFQPTPQPVKPQSLQQQQSQKSAEKQDKQSHKQFVNSVSPAPSSYDWTHVLTQKYKMDMNALNFNCPRDGLFAHPFNCNLFIQCLDYGTVYKRFYVLNCPAGLYFNTKLDLCDYPDNVYCPN